MSEPLPELDKMEFLASNPDWNKFVRGVSDNTGALLKKQWIKNATANKDRVKQCGWAADKFWNVGSPSTLTWPGYKLLPEQTKTAIIVGAGPSLKGNIDYLYEVVHDPRFLIIAISSGVKYLLLEKEIKPDFTLIVDSDPDIIKWFEGIGDKAKGLKLISSLCVHPDLLDIWEGEISFLGIFTAVKKLDRKLRKLYSPVNGEYNNQFFPALSSQYNIAAAMAYLIFRCNQLIFIGNELSFEEKESKYYVDRKDKKDKWPRMPVIDIYGKQIYTTHMFYSLKLALEEFLGKVPGVFINATERGILGVSKRHGNLSWIHQLTFKWAIRQTKAIMETGRPITLT